MAGLWSAWRDPKGTILHSFTMLTINADHHPLMNQFHKPTDEKRMIVILPPERYDDWLKASARRKWGVPAGVAGGMDGCRANIRRARPGIGGVVSYSFQIDGGRVCWKFYTWVLKQPRAAKPGCEPDSGGNHVRNIPHRPDYSAGFAG